MHAKSTLRGIIRWVAIVFVSLALYALSYGPYVWMLRKGVHFGAFYAVTYNLYAPLRAISPPEDPSGNLMDRYMSFWR